MATFDELIDKAVDNGGIPGVVLLARDKTGRFQYTKTAGKRSLEPGTDQPMTLDTVFKLASSSKFLTTIACLQAVERGLIGLDDDVAPHIPVLAAQPILTGFTWYGKPLTTPRTKPITLRTLLTQTAGTGYDFLPIHPLWRYRWWMKEPIAQGETVDQRLGYPLLHEPGEGWTYGSGATWAGQVLEKVSGMGLEEWIKKYINEPLGLTSVTFFPGQTKSVAERMAGVAQRKGWAGGLVHYPGANKPESEVEAMGGEGAYASLEDYIKILESLLVDDEKLLKKETTAMMFSPQLTEVERKPLHECLDRPIWICNTILKKGEYDWGVGGVLIDGDSHECLKRGSLMWSGLFHVLWWIDRKAGVCGVFGTQVLPGTDKIVVPLIGAFQREVYDRMNHGGQKPAWKAAEKTKVLQQTSKSTWTSQNGADEKSLSPLVGLFGWASGLWRKSDC